MSPSTLFLWILSSAIYLTLPVRGLGKTVAPEILVKPNIWGGASTQDIEQVLNSTARQIWPYVPQGSRATIQVERSRTGPIVLFRRGERGEYLVRLDTEKTFWSQYAFQFAHELGHIICGYKKGDRSNLWFEETICETASLFVLRKMTDEWKSNPPYPNWKDYGPEFAQYAQKRMNKHPWSKELPVAEWYKKQNASLMSQPTNRSRNVQLAMKLLPFFEQDPSRWSACMFLNKDKSHKKLSFKNYLINWKINCLTVKQKKFVEEISQLFGFKN